jgi:membrane protease YdiL (CAAX protease family)
VDIVVISAIFAIINVTLEEMFWRGTFVTVFPTSWVWGYLYPSIGFGYWHFAPQVIFPSQMPGGAFTFATMSIGMGLTFGWVAKKTGSIRWTTIAHILTDFMGLAGLVFIGEGY